MNPKQLAGERAVEYVSDGMDIGLGTGSTVFWTIRKLGELVAGGMKVRGVATSRSTEQVAAEFGVPLLDLDDVEELELTIDGADEIDPRLNLIKGGGGALLREKMVAEASKRLIIVADASKRVDALGRFPLPLEVVPFGWQKTAKRIASLGISPTLRIKDGSPFITDNGNLILDCDCGLIHHPASLSRELKCITGVVEVGLFVAMANEAIIAGAEEVELIAAG